MTHKNRKKYKQFHILKYWMFSLRDERYSCSLEVLHGGLRINKLQFLIIRFFSAVNFFSILVTTPWIRIRIERLKCRFRIRIETNADPHHCGPH
jgi:hypothetical protein